MLMSDVFMWVAIASGFVAGLPALWMLSRGLWPKGFEKRCTVARRSLGASFIVGLVPAVVFIALIAGMAKRLGPIPGAVLSGVLILWGLNGLVGVASLIGERLWPDGQPWKQTRNGGLVIICCGLLPLVGWILLLPIMIVTGMGVNIRCLFTRTVRQSVPPPMPSSVMLEAPNA